MGIYIVRNSNGGVSSLQPRATIGNLENGDDLSITLDASISETHSFDSIVPEFPVENGAAISDTVINLPARLEMRGVVGVTGGDPYRADDALKDMLTIRDNRELITVVTSVRVYNNMILSNFSFPRDKATGEKFVFTATFKEIILADVSLVTIDKIKPTAQKKASPKKDEPEQATTEPDLSVQGLMDELRLENENIFAAESTGVFI